MANDVYANGREVSCKQASGKSIASFPDVCFTPPQTPATPPGVPLPYPNTGMSSDCTEGSKTVEISGQEVMLKDKSYFKKSSGNEAGSAPKKGVVSSKNMGKVYFTMWSMDVKFEGENVVRHLDMTTHNHGNTPNTGPWPFTSKAAAAKGGKCDKEVKKEKQACADYDPHTQGGGSPCKDAGLMKASSEISEAEAQSMARAVQRGAFEGKKTSAAEKKALKCVRARRCKLGPYKPSQCCPSQTPDHVLPKSSFYMESTKGEKLPGWRGESGYKPNKAPCMCAEGPNNTWGSHGLRHAYHKNVPPEGVQPDEKMPFGKAANHSAEGSSKVFKASGCRKKCIEEQVKKGHEDMYKGDDAPDVKYSPSGSTESPKDVTAAVSKMNKGGGRG